MEAFLSKHGFDYINLCHIMIKDVKSRIFITDESALFVYLTIAGKSPDWAPSNITFIADIFQLSVLHTYISSIGYNMRTYRDDTWTYNKSGSIPVQLCVDSKYLPALSVLDLKWAPDTRFINGDNSAIVDAINMRAICRDKHDNADLITVYKRRGFRIFREL
jgi:hypothetical protein